MAHPLFTAVFRYMAMDMVRPVGAKCLAECYDYRLYINAGLFLCLEKLSVTT